MRRLIMAVTRRYHVALTNHTDMHGISLNLNHAKKSKKLRQKVRAVSMRKTNSFYYYITA